MAMNVTPFVGTDNFNMETFNNMISQINNGVNSEISEVLVQLGTKARIQTGSYVGTGTYGARNPCSLTFDSKPQFIIVASSTGSFFVATRGQNQSSTNYGATYYNVILTWGEQDILWYNTNNAGNQLNNSGITYCYTIIGT